MKSSGKKKASPKSTSEPAADLIANEKSDKAGVAKKNRPDRDRRVRQADRLARILRVLQLIQSRGRWTTKAIADEIECSERTVYRDLDVLRFAGIPYYRDGDQQFVRVRSDFRFPVMGLNEDEVIGLSVSAVMSKASGLDVTTGAVPTAQKLAASSRTETQELMDDAMRLVSVLDLKLVDHSRHHEMIRTVQQGLLQGKVLSGSYESPYETRTVRLKLHPYRLCLIKTAWYLIGTIAGEAFPRTFRIVRFKSLKLVEEQAVIPEHFDLGAYFGNAWSVYRGEKSYDVELWFNPQSARIVSETIWHHTQKTSRHQDGSLTLKFTIDGLEEILNWILGWTGNCKVIQPAELRDRVVARLREALATYGDETRGDHFLE